MRCDHQWPDELLPETPCERCGLAYGDWSEPLAATEVPAPSDEADNGQAADAMAGPGSAADQVQVLQPSGSR